jgi:hypothetical protein
MTQAKELKSESDAVENYRQSKQRAYDKHVLGLDDHKELYDALDDLLGEEDMEAEDQIKIGDTTINNYPAPEEKKSPVAGIGKILLPWILTSVLGGGVAGSFLTDWLADSDPKPVQQEDTDTKYKVGFSHVEDED